MKVDLWNLVYITGADHSRSQGPSILFEYIYICNEKLGLDMMESK